ncbi:MAG: transcription elongation factor GreA [Phycisphaerales bacterium]|nr:transcription elongation factor GreA [Planctomycetota bacterium]MCH8508461.1 transcription elongation factor GreA [Phycisphaerales bacterium]
MDVITAEEKARLKARMDELIANRSVITQRIADARALGDLKENAEYHAAREQQGLEEAEIRRLEERITTAQVVDDSRMADGVAFIGSTVKVREVGDDEIESYRLVGESSGSDDPDIIEVTASSPMGEALMKARVGETVRVNAPRGVKRFEIVEIL